VKRLGICIGQELRFDEIVRQVKVCDQEEIFESIWIAEDYFLRDAVSVAANFASLTKNMKICLGIVNPYTRNPALLAMTIATLDEISTGRLVCGIGPGVRSKYIRMGVRADKRLSTVRDTVDVLRRLLKRENVSCRGATFRMESVHLGFTPLRENIPIYLAAVGPKMLQLAGEIADGVLLTAASSPRYVRKALENIRIGAEKSGRDPSSVDIACYVICSLSDSSQEALEAARVAVASNLAPAEYGRLILEETGLDPSVFDRIAKVDKDETGVKISPQVVPDDVVDELSASGTPERFRGRLDEYLSSGVALPILYPVGLCFSRLIGYLQQSRESRSRLLQ
jgi:5,10-methylenetetrahydromethanopterin reductase